MSGLIDRQVTRAAIVFPLLVVRAGLRRCFEIGGIATPAIVASSSSDASSVFGFGDATATSRRIRALPEKLVLSARSVFSRAQVEPDADGSASTDMPLLAGLFGGDDV
jgi:hypothetical protein